MNSFFIILISILVGVIGSFVAGMLSKKENKKLFIISTILLFTSTGLFVGYSWGQKVSCPESLCIPTESPTPDSVGSPSSTPLILPLAPTLWDSFDSVCLDSRKWVNYDNSPLGNCLPIVGITQKSGYLEVNFLNDGQFARTVNIYEEPNYTNNDLSAFESELSITDISGSALGYGELGIRLSDTDISLSLSLRAVLAANDTITYYVVRKITEDSDEEIFPITDYQLGKIIYLSIVKINGRLYTYQNGFLVGESVLVSGPLDTFSIFHRENPGTWLEGHFDEVRLNWE
jgi:hypothetical protein